MIHDSDDSRYDDDLRDDELHDDEGPDEADIAHAEAAAENRCPACDAELYEDAVICSACGLAISDDPPSLWSNRRWWWVLLAALGIAALVLALVASF